TTLNGPEPPDETYQVRPSDQKMSSRRSPNGWVMNLPTAISLMEALPAYGLSSSQSEMPPQDTSRPAPFFPTTSVRPSPSKSPNRSVSTLSVRARRNRHSALPSGA